MRKRMWRFGATLLVLGLLSAGAHGVAVSPVPLGISEVEQKKSLEKPNAE